MATTPLNLGFLSILQEGNGYLGGYLVTNVWGRPLEFRLSSAVQPNKVQQILYGDTLVPYICGDLIGKTLVDKAGVPVQLVVTSCEQALDLRLKLEVPVVWLTTADDARAGLILPEQRGGLVFHASQAGDRATVEEYLKQIEGNMDLTEPFSRVREAITEARRMGVTGRSAA
ncbi:MAG: hypothetical protein U0840_18280 [Gemmataceae bacterium]